MFCAISGVTPEVPVVSKTTGFLYENRLILKHLDASGGKCPETGNDMSADDLVLVKVAGPTISPMPSSSASLPGLLVQMQNEWDAVMLEVHRLKVDLHATRQELAQALYQYDAATRVIVRLQREAAQTHSQIPGAQNGAAAAPDVDMERIQTSESVAHPAAQTATPTDPDDPMQGATKVLPDQWVTKIRQRSVELIAQRKNRVKESSTTAAQIGAFTETANVSVSSNAHSHPVTAMGLRSEADGLVVGFADGGLRKLKDMAYGSLLRDSPHSAAIDTIAFRKSSQELVSSSEDGVVVCWKGQSPTELTSVSDPTLSGLALHQVDSLLVSSLASGQVRLADVDSNQILAKNQDAQQAHSLAVHVDGLLASIGGAQGDVSILDLTTMQTATTLSQTDASGVVSCLEFSENGYYLVSASGSAVTLWDMRKQKAIRSLDCSAMGTVKNVSLDISGSLLGIACHSGVRVVETKKLHPLWGHEEQEVSSACWGPNASWLAAGCQDGKTVIYGTPS